MLGLFDCFKRIQTVVPPPVDVFLAKIDGFEDSGLPMERGATWWVPGLGLGTHGLLSPALGGIIKPFGWQKRYMRIGT